MLVLWLATALAQDTPWTDADKAKFDAACNQVLVEMSGTELPDTYAKICGCAQEEMSKQGPVDNMDSTALGMQVVTCSEPHKSEPGMEKLVRGMWGQDAIDGLAAICREGIAGTEIQDGGGVCACTANELAKAYLPTEIIAMGEEAAQQAVEAQVQACITKVAATGGIDVDAIVDSLDIPTPASDQGGAKSSTPSTSSEDAADLDSDNEPERIGVTVSLEGSYDISVGGTARDLAFTGGAWYSGSQLPVGVGVLLHQDNFASASYRRVDVMLRRGLFGFSNFNFSIVGGGGMVLAGQGGFGANVGGEVSMYLGSAGTVSFVPYVRITKPFGYDVDEAYVEPLVHFGIRLPVAL